MGSNNILKGNLMIDPVVTPIYSSWIGPNADRWYSLFTGRGRNAAGQYTTHIEDIGSIRSIDNANGQQNTDDPYIWLNEQLWNGN